MASLTPSAVAGTVAWPARALTVTLTGVSAAWAGAGVARAVAASRAAPSATRRGIAVCIALQRSDSKGNGSAPKFATDSEVCQCAREGRGDLLGIGGDIAEIAREI